MTEINVTRLHMPVEGPGSEAGQVRNPVRWAADTFRNRGMPKSRLYRPFWRGKWPGLATLILWVGMSADAALVFSPKIDMHQAEAERYANHILPMIISNWNVSVFLENAHSIVWQGTTERELETVFFAYRKLGALQHLSPVSGSVVLSYTPEGDPFVVGSYQAQATFQNADATIVLVTIKDGRSWKCASLIVSSDALFESRPPPADPMAQMRMVLGAKPAGERTRIEDEILSLDELAIRRRWPEVVALAEIREANGENERAADLYAAALRGQSADLETQIKLAEIHASLGRTREALDRARTVYRLAENRVLFDRARSLLAAENACPPPPRLREEGMPANVEFVLVPFGDVHIQMVLELQAELQSEMNVRFLVWDGTLPLPKAARTAANQYLEQVFAVLTQEVTRLQFEDLLESVGIREMPATFSPEQKQELLDAYLDRLGPGASEMRRNHETYLQMLNTQPQHHALCLINLLEETFITNAVDSIKGFIGITEADLFADGANFVFGSAFGDYGVISAARFLAAPGLEPQSRPRLVKRLKKQAMSTLGFIVDIPRCADPFCARAFPASVAEHDAKSEHLCPECQARLDAYTLSPQSAFAAALHIHRAGEEHQKTGDLSRSISALRRAVQLCGSNADTWHHLGQLLFDTCDLAGAEQALYHARHLAPGDIDIPLTLSRVYSAQGRLEEAIRIMDALIESHPSHDMIHAERARLADAAGDFERARKLISAAMQLGPTNSTVFSIAAAIQNNHGDYPAALAAGLRALELDTNNVSAAYVVGMALSNSDKPQQANPYLSRALGAFFREAPLWRMYAVSCASLGKMDEALVAFQKAVDLDPSNAGFVSDLGFTYFMLGRQQEALAHYDQAIEMDPGIGITHYNRAMVCHAMGEPLKALDSLNRARLAGYPGSPQFRMQVEQAVRQVVPPHPP